MNYENLRDALSVVLLFLLFSSTPVQADTLDLFGVGGRASSMGGAATAGSDDYSSLYYNIGALGLAKNQIAAGFLLTSDRVSIQLMDRPSGYDIPDVNGLNAIPYNNRLRSRQSTKGVSSANGIIVGAVSDLGIDTLRLGFLAFFPLSGLGSRRSYYPDEREQWFSNRLYFELLGDQTQREVINFGIAARPLEWISLGVGVSVGLGTKLNTSVYMPNPTEQEEAYINLNVQSGTSYAINLGILLWPIPWLKVGASFQGEQAVHLTGGNEIQVRGLHDSEDYPSYQKLDFTVGFAPMKISAGVEFVSYFIKATIDLVYERWSTYLNQHSELAGFKDILVPRMGIEGRIWDLFLRAGVAYEKSPVPDQPGRTNYVDNDRLLLTLGMGVRPKFFNLEFDISLHLQAHFLFERTTHKALAESFESCETDTSGLCDEVLDGQSDPLTSTAIPESYGLQTGNPGFPGYVSGGVLLGVGLDIRWEF